MITGKIAADRCLDRRRTNGCGKLVSHIPHAKKHVGVMVTCALNLISVENTMGMDLRHFG